MKTVIHVHQQKIKKNEPAIITRTYKKSTRHRKVDIICPCGCNFVAATVFQSEIPDKCGARVWINASKVDTYDEEGSLE